MTSGIEHIVTDEIKTKIRALCAFGHTQEQIAKYLSVSVDTLDRHYRVELDTAKVDAVLQAANRLFRKGVQEGDTTALIFYLKTQAGWKEPKDDSARDTLIEKLLDKLK